jgi:hypothetical protein
LFEGPPERDLRGAVDWLYYSLGLKGDILEIFPSSNLDRSRVAEFFRFYIANPTVSGLRRFYAAELAVGSLVEALV